MSAAPDPTSRFSDRVENYAKFRPGYPDEVIHWLCGKAHLTAGSRVADLGSGTGLSSVYFLDRNCEVFAVEPNDAMRAVAERTFKDRNHFHSIAAKAEATTLPAQSIDLIIAAQAFHWFDPAATRVECERILKPGAWIALIWNVRRLDSTPFLRDYEALLLKYGTDYVSVRHENVDESRLDAFFGGQDYETFTAPYIQQFDFEALKGRLLSSSYVPAAGAPGHEGMLDELTVLFDRHQIEGHVAMEYDTVVHAGAI